MVTLEAIVFRRNGKRMNKQKSVTPDAQSLVASISATKTRGLPPVHLWDPPFCGDLDMRIARDGSWFYQGTPIGRPQLVKLFSSILKREKGKYFLVTPVEKVGIIVDDAPFLAVDFDVQGDDLVFETKTEDVVRASADNPIRVDMDDETGEPSPYVLVRNDLWALIDRKSFYRLVELGTVEGDMFGVRSAGAFFPIMSASDLEG
jgi:hypothetical protein